MKFIGEVRIVTTFFSASLLLLALFPARLAASALTIAWDPNQEDDLAGYKIYYGTRSRDYDSVVDTGNVSQYTIRGLEPGTLYYLALTAYDNLQQESDFSAEVSAITDEESAPSPSPSSTLIDGEDAGGCFIAMVAYGSYLNPQVKILRDFRDEFLISNSLGRKFVHVYYQYGPLIANHIEQYDFLQFLSRQALFPLVGMSSLSLKTASSPGQLLLLVPLLLTVLLISLLPLRSHHRKGAINSF